MLLKLRRLRWYITERRKIKRQIADASRKGKLKIILGAGPTKYDGWISTDLPHFNITKESDWKYFFGETKIDNILAEHVFEHLTPDENFHIFKIISRYLKPNGKFRIAVPDEFHINPDYYECVRPGGSGPGADDHKSFWNYITLQSSLQKAGLTTFPIEYWDQNKQFILNRWDELDGYVKRSRQLSFSLPNIHDYSSLIVDAIFK